MIKNDLRKEEVSNFMARFGRPGKRLVEYVLDQADWAAAFNTSVGQEVLKEVRVLLDEKLGKIVDGTADDDDRAEFRVLKRLGEAWAKRIMAYQKAINKIKVGGSNGA